MSVFNRFGTALLLASLVVIVAGCGGYKGPPLAKCSGTVTLDGTPVEGAKVTMSSSNGTANGTTDASGKFTMETLQGGKGWPGAPVGTLSVAITKFPKDDLLEKLGPAPDPSDATASKEYTDKAAQLQMERTMAGGGPPQNVLPEKYASPTTSELKVELPKEGKEGITFELKAAP